MDELVLHNAVSIVAKLENYGIGNNWTILEITSKNYRGEKSVFKIALSHGENKLTWDLSKLSVPV